MQRTMLKSKIHRARITGGDLHYEGSLSIDPELMRAADIRTDEQVHVVVVDNGARFTTYAIEGEPGEMRLNGAAARLAMPGDTVIVMTYAQVEEAELARWHPRVVQVDSCNHMLVAEPV